MAEGERTPALEPAADRLRQSLGSRPDRVRRIAKHPIHGDLVLPSRRDDREDLLERGHLHPADPDGARIKSPPAGGVGGGG